MRKHVSISVRRFGILSDAGFHYENIRKHQTFRINFDSRCFSGNSGSESFDTLLYCVGIDSQMRILDRRPQIVMLSV